MSTTKTDIQHKSDIKAVVDRFYETVKEDETIGYIFTEAVVVNWAEHLPVMYSFWESVIFGSGNYRGNPMLKHLELHKKVPLTKAHFERWMEIWEETVRGLFTGSRAEELIQKARNMKELMLYKIQASSNHGFIQ